MATVWVGEHVVLFERVRVLVPLLGRREDPRATGHRAARPADHPVLPGRPHHHRAARDGHGPAPPTEPRLHGQGGGHPRLAVGRPGRPRGGRGLARGGVRRRQRPVAPAGEAHGRVPGGAGDPVARRPLLLRRRLLHPAAVVHVPEARPGGRTARSTSAARATPPCVGPPGRVRAGTPSTGRRTSWPSPWPARRTAGRPRPEPPDCASPCARTSSRWTPTAPRPTPRPAPTPWPPWCCRSASTTSLPARRPPTGVRPGRHPVRTVQGPGVDVAGSPVGRGVRLFLQGHVGHQVPRCQIDVVEVVAP